MRISCLKVAFCGPKRLLYTVKIDGRREPVATLYVCLNCPATKSHLSPSNSTICCLRLVLLARLGNCGLAYVGEAVSGQSRRCNLDFVGLPI